MSTLIRKKKQFDWESACVYVFYALAFFLPLFFLPLAIKPIAFAKSLLFYSATSLAFIFWLFSRLQKGGVKFLKSGLVFAAGGVAAVWFISSVFSLNPSLSILGGGYEIGTFAFFAFSAVALFLVSTVFQDEKKAVIFYLLLLLSSSFVFLFQVLRTVFNISIPPSSVFPLATSNLVGGWNDLAIFFGLMALSALCFLELTKFSRLLKAVLSGVIIVSMLAMLAVNFFAAWLIFGFAVLVLLVYFLCLSYVKKDREKNFVSSKIIRPTLFVLLAVSFFIFARGWIGDLTATMNTGITEIRPSWNATADIVWKTLKEHPVLGSGPNTFSYDWLKFKPAAINDTMFWNSRFSSGIGHLPSMVATAGVFGGLSLLVFFFFFLSYGAKILTYEKNDFRKTILITSFLGSFYLWMFTVFYTPGFLIFALAFLLTGVFVATLARAGMVKTVEISFLNRPKAGFASVLIIVLLVIFAIFSMHILLRQYWAARYYTQSVEGMSTGGDTGEAGFKMERAALIGGRDMYFRELSGIGLIRMRQVLSQKDASADVLRSRFQDALGSAIASAKKAVELNPSDALNWMQLGTVYESAIPFNVSGASELAIGAYKEAFAVSPLDPEPYLAMARVRLAAGDAKEARNFIKSSLKIKRDFAPALFLFSQIEAKEGNLKEAIQRAGQTLLVAPNDIGALFQFGILNYRGKNYRQAAAAFERIISLNPNYSNANYFLGLIYDKQGMKKRAISLFEKVEKLNPDNKEVKLILRNLRSGDPALKGVSSTEASPETKGELSGE